MSGKLKITENTKGGDTTYTETPEKFKSKKRSESSLDKDDPEDVKITLPSSKSDDCSLSRMSKYSHETDRIPRKKTKIIHGPLVNGPKVTEDQDDTEKDDKVSNNIEGSKQTSVCVTTHPLLKTPPPFDNKWDYKGDTHDETPDSSTKDTNVKKIDDSLKRNLDKETNNADYDEYIDNQPLQINNIKSQTK